MPRRIRALLGALVALFLAPPPAPACSLCYNPQATPTFRQDVAKARLVLFGTLANPRLAGDNLLAGGTTDLRLDKVLKSDPFLGDRKVVELPRYVPVDPQAPPRYLVFCDVVNGKLDPYRGVPVSAAAADYVRGACALDPADPVRAIVYFFGYLDHADPAIAADAFLEFVKAGDRDLGLAAPRLSAAKLRGWLEDPRTPDARLSLFALLLGGCGGDRDAALLRSWLDRPAARTAPALDGALAGYIQLRPREGWALARARLADDTRPFTERYAVLRTLRFYHGWKPTETRRPVLDGLAVAVAQDDVADLAVEDLRRWQDWDLTALVLAQYGKKGQPPIVRRALLRYALCCPKPEAARFAAAQRQRDPMLVQEVEENLQYEKQPAK